MQLYKYNRIMLCVCIRTEGGDRMFLKAKKEIIRQKRINAGLSQHKLSKLAGLGSSAVFRMEEKDYFVNHLRAEALARVLGCTVEDIFENKQ